MFRLNYSQICWVGTSIKNKDSDNHTAKGCIILEAKVPPAISREKLGQDQHVQLLNFYFLKILFFHTKNNTYNFPPLAIF